MRSRVEFSFERPMIVSALELVYAGKRYTQGAAFPWLELGVSREYIWQLWQTFVVDCVEPKPVPAMVVVSLPAKGAAQQSHRQQHRR